MKPILTALLAAGTVAAIAMPAQAGSHVGININTGPGYGGYYVPAPVYYAPPPVYYAPAPVYYAPAPSYRFFYSNGYERHRHGYNWGYWNNGRGNGHGNGHGRGHR